MSLEVPKKEEIICFKILLLGDSSVGKSAFIVRFCEGRFDEACLITVGIDKKIKFVEKDGKKLQLLIWDTAGQERFRSIAKNCYKGADGIILMYDISNIETFNHIKNWISSIKEDIDINKIGLIVVGNKYDLRDNEKKVDEKSKKQFEEENNMKIIDASAKIDFNVNESFIALIDKMLKLGLGQKKNDDDEFDKDNNSHRLKKDGGKKKKDCCIAKKK